MATTRFWALFVPALSGVSGGAVGALVVLALAHSGTGKDPVPRPELDQGDSKAERAALGARVATLESSLRQLALRSALISAAAQAKGATGQGADSGAADVAPIVDNPVFEAAVRDVMGRAEEERSLEREAQRAEWRKRAANDWANQLGQKLRLTDTQKAKVTEVANAFWDRLRDLRNSDAGAAASRSEWREQVSTLRKSAEGELSQVLDPTQMNSYRELDEASQLGVRPGGRGGQR
jgi:hypothetical protein